MNSPHGRCSSTTAFRGKMVTPRWVGKDSLQEQPACVISDSIHHCSGAAEGLHNAVNLGKANGARAVVCGIEGVLHSCTRKSFC